MKSVLMIWKTSRCGCGAKANQTAPRRIAWAKSSPFYENTGLQNVSVRPGYLRKKVLPYSEEDLRCLFEASTGDEKLLFSFFLGTGAREQEAAFATFGDIDFENKLFLVRAKPDLGFMPKDREERSVPI